MDGAGLGGDRGPGRADAGDVEESGWARLAHERRQDVFRPHERGDVAACRALVEVGGRADLGEPSVLQQPDAGRDRERLVLVVGDEDEGGPGLALDAEQFLARLLPQAAVERGERLVEEEEAWAGRERAGERHALPLAAGECVGAAVLVALQPHEGEQVAHAGGGFAPGHALAAQAERHVAGDREVGEQGRRTGTPC